MDLRELEALDARVRLKLDRGEPLLAEERAFFARMPASREMPPEEVLRRARERHP